MGISFLSTAFVRITRLSEMTLRVAACIQQRLRQRLQSLRRNPFG